MTELVEAVEMPREEVRAFAVVMERKLRQHDDLDGWQGVDRWALAAMLAEHVAKLDLALVQHRDPVAIAEAAADCANYAMMIADVVGGLAADTAREG